MTEYNTVNVKWSNLQLKKSRKRSLETEVTLKISSNIVGDSNNWHIFPHDLLLSGTQFSKFRESFGNGSSANIILSKTQLHKIGQSGGFVGRLLGPLLKTGFALTVNVLKPLSKSVLTLFRMDHFGAAH